MPQLADVVAACGFNPAQVLPPQQQGRPVAVVEAPGPCDLLKGSGLANGLPLPGSQEWCDISDRTGAAFAEIFGNVLQWLVGQNPLDEAIKELKLDLPEGVLASPVRAVFSLWNEIVDALGDMAQSVITRIRNIVRQVINVYKCLNSSCNTSAYLGVWCLWQLARIMREIEIGWELGPKLTARIELDFPGLSEWLEALMRFYCPTEVPSSGEATHAWLLNRISREWRDCIWKANGNDPRSFEPFALSEREQLEWREAIQYVRRTGGGEDAERDALRNRGFVDASDVTMAREMYWELPGIADHLHWLSRNVFDTDYVRDYKLLDGFDTRFWPVFGPDLTALGMKKHYAEYHYAAHWIMPSPEQMHQFLYRSDEIAAATGKGFTLDDFERILTEQDYNPLARQWFRAIAFQVPAISYVKAMFQQGVIGPGDLATYHKRLGYSQEDANRFAGIDELQKARMRAAATRGWTTGAANNAWVTSQITVQEHNRHFADLGYTAAEAEASRSVADMQLRYKVATRAFSRSVSSLITTMTQSIEVGTLTPDQAAQQLKDNGWPGNLADAFAHNQSAVGSLHRIKQAIAFIRSNTINGAINAAQAQAELQRLGLTAAAVQGYLFTWRVHQTTSRKRLSAQKISSAVAKGRMSTAEGIVRLRNLGYDDADSRIYLADSQAALQKAQQATLAAGEKKGLARQKALAQQAKAAEKLKGEIVKSMVRDMPVAKLEKWLKLGIIGKDFFRQRMTLYGFSNADIEWRTEEACSGKKAACKDTTTPVKETEGSGGGGVVVGK